MRPRWWRVGGALALTAGLVVAAAPSTGAVDTDIAISTTAIDFGQVNIGSTAQVSVTLTNTGGDPFGPVNMFGGAPPTNEFNASQNCQGTTLAAGGSCMVNYSFSPGTTGTFNDTSAFTVSETMNQSDGEDFTVTLTGVGCDPNTSCTTTTTAAPTTTVATATTLSPSTPTNAPPNNVPGGGGTATTLAPVKELEVEVDREKVALGQEQTAHAKGFQPGEPVTATSQPDGRAIGTQNADENGAAEFTWIVAEADGLGAHEFVAAGATSGAVSTPYEIVATAAEATDDDSGTSPWLIALIILLVVAAILAAALIAYRRGRKNRPDDGAPAPVAAEPRDPAEMPTDPGPPGRVADPGDEPPTIAQP